MAKEKRRLDRDDGHPKKKRASVTVKAFNKSSLEQLVAMLEPMIRTVLEPMIHKNVTEEVRREFAKLEANIVCGKCGSSCMLSPKPVKRSDERNLKLQFRSKLALPLFAGEEIKGQQGSLILVELIDGNTGNVVTSGPESSAKLDIVVLRGDFNDECSDNWTQEEFTNCIVKERKGKGPLLMGDLQVTLRKGVGNLGNLIFTDNSSWTSNKMFKVGATVADGYCEGLHIVGGSTKAFRVKDQRGKGYEKHYKPTWDDKIWRLEKIAKDGKFHKRLNKDGICTVEDFLRHLVRDSDKLRRNLQMKKNAWEQLVEHAKTCILSRKIYVFYVDHTKDVAVVLNSIYNLRGLISYGQYHPVQIDSLSDSQKDYLDTQVKKAYDNWIHVLEYDCEELMLFEQSKLPRASPSEILVSLQGFPASNDQQWPCSVSVPPLKHSLASDFSVTGDVNDLGSRYAMHPSQVTFNGQTHFSGSSTLQNQLISSSHEAQRTINDGRVDAVIGSHEASSSAFQIMCSSNLYNDHFSPDEQLQELLNHISMENHNSELFQSASYSWNHEEVQTPIRTTQRDRWQIFFSVLRWKISIKRRIIASPRPVLVQ
ncbi:hypothetical protein MKW94_014034 [Papaver nudicaule]|uniref:Calmodulin-binding protein n=1 Tax=Papaver nudicaule TaxID=74823 RepID=A0AA41VEF4_PAPNU|nr:hypothetical protein [Papaver nudicaule]